MLNRFLLLALLLGSSTALAAEPAKGPVLSDLMKQETYLAAWKTMLGAEAVPDWVANYAKTLDGPATPSIEVQVSGDPYRLAFTCKAHDCGSNQLYVLFAPSGRQAWGLLAIPGQHRWLGNPDPAIQTAILSSVE